MNWQKRQARQLHFAQMQAFNAQAANAAQQAQLAAAHQQAVQQQQWRAAVDHARAQAAAAPIKCPACSRINPPRSTSCAGCASRLEPNRPYLPPPPVPFQPAKPSPAVQVWRGFRRLPTWVQVLAWLFLFGTISSALGLNHDNQDSPSTAVTVTTSQVRPATSTSVAPETSTEGTP